MSNKRDVTGWLDDEYAETQLERAEFLAALLLEVLQADNTVRPWKDVATNMLYVYNSNRQRFIDNDRSGILTRTQKGDWWVRRSYITNAKRRKMITDILASQGHFLGAIVGQGIYLATTKSEMRQIHNQNIRGVQSRAESISFRANEINQHADVDLPLLVTQALLPDGQNTA